MCFRPATVSMVECPECGASNASTSDVCVDCGANLPETASDGIALGMAAPGVPAPGISAPGAPAK